MNGGVAFAVVFTCVREDETREVDGYSRSVSNLCDGAAVVGVRVLLKSSTGVRSLELNIFDRI